MRFQVAKKCAYCGEPATTKDHVVAKTLLFDPTLPVIVDACQKCNTEKSRDDEYLRDVFAIRIETATLQEMAANGEKMKRSALRPEKISPGNTMLRTFSRLPVISASGDLLGYPATVEVHLERIFAGLKWIVRGLYFHHQNQVLNPNFEYQWWAYDGNDNKDKFDAIWPTTSHNGPYTVGGCLAYKVGVCAEIPEYSNWLLTFYDRLFFIISINEQMLIAKGKELGHVLSE